MGVLALFAVFSLLICPGSASFLYACSALRLVLVHRISMMIYVFRSLLEVILTLGALLSRSQSGPNVLVFLITKWEKVYVSHWLGIVFVLQFYRTVTVNVVTT